ncbi:dihydrofolate reductase family protein [Deinococcus sp. QL22]|uniref:dihydrofolate reductase family protein n=1 Tax=Deinococcus sp. QL22 TaxID=2939437 RepID=UPI0020181499|nr:dihydrofolate reductase family protein [Deinococcus sp. QL22]UQN09188.1 dihydrofolate reductase family protein [Deinococcus sp. QL22]
MRKVTSGLFISMDGVVENPAEWQETFDEDMGAELAETLSQIDTILLGRKTYQGWASYWPMATTDLDYASLINQTPKYVVSRTLHDVEWGPFDTVQLLQGNLAEGIGKLKAQPGKNIAVQGSPTLVNSLIQHDLLDELTLYIHNVVAYHGRRLFDGGQLKRFDLIRSQSTRSGIVIATYHPRRG